jgi:hypothetical protein
MSNTAYIAAVFGDASTLSQVRQLYPGAVAENSALGTLSMSVPLPIAIWPWLGFLSCGHGALTRASFTAGCNIAKSGRSPFH